MLVSCTVGFFDVNARSDTVKIKHTLIYDDDDDDEEEEEYEEEDTSEEDFKGVVNEYEIEVEENEEMWQLGLQNTHCCISYYIIVCPSLSL